MLLIFPSSILLLLPSKSCVWRPRPRSRRRLPPPLERLLAPNVGHQEDSTKDLLSLPQSNSVFPLNCRRPRSMLSLSLYFSLSISLSLYFSLSLFLSLSLSLTYTFSVKYYSLSHSQRRLSIFLSLFRPRFLYPSFSLSLPLSFFLFLSLSLPPSLFPFFSFFLFLSLSLPTNTHFHAFEKLTNNGRQLTLRCRLSLEVAISRCRSVTRCLDYFIIIRPFTTIKICPMAKEICRSKYKILPNTKQIL